MTEIPTDQQILELIIKAIVNNPEAVKVERKIDEMGVLLSLKVDPQDMAQIIGRQGATAKALRTILKVVGAKNRARVNLKIEEPEGSTKVREEKKEEKIEDVTDGLDDLKI